MEYSQNYNFNLPSRDKDDIVDINLISDNFRVIDNVLNDAQNSSYIKNNKVGSVVVANDVSPIEHDLNVSVASDTVEDLTTVTVTRPGKNLLKYPYYDFTAKGNPVTVNGVTFTDNGDGSITINGTSTAQTYFAVETSNIKLQKGQTYTLSGFPKGHTTSTAYLNVRNTTYEQHIRNSGNSVTFTAEYTDYYSQIYIANGVTLNNVVVRPQLEIGDTATGFELYKEPQTATPSADGTVEGLTSISPKMMVYTNNSGVNIDITYNADTKMYVDNKIADIVAIGDIPKYWQTHLDERVEAIRRAMESAGRNKSSFFFYSDAHWDNENTYTSKLAPTLLKYLHKKTPINKTNFGGDIVFGEGSSNTDTMEYLWDWREQLRDLPNHHSVIGNHDDGHGTNDRILSKEYIYSYLLAPEENNDIVWGGDFYYYIDDKAENTRYLYLDVFYEGISSSQKEFVKEAIKTVPAAWHIIAIGHAWFANDYSVYPPVLNGFATEVQDLLGMFDRYNAREGEFAECVGWVELCIGGHYHLDHYEHTTGGIPVIIVEADTFHDRGGTMPTHGNTSESAVSAVVVDYYDKIVKVIRVGRGESYEVPINRVSPPNYTNVIPLSIDKDGTPFANGKGWMANSRIGSGGIYAGNQTAGTDSAQWVTGHIEINPNIDNVIRLKNVTFQQNTSNSNHGIAFFNSSFSRVVAYGSTNFITPNNITEYGGYSPVLDSDTNILEFTLSAEQHLTNKDVKYIAICCGGISDNSIITINEPIK